MKSHGILSRYMRPGYAAGDTVKKGFLQELKDAFYEMGQPGDNTYDGKRKREMNEMYKKQKDDTDLILKDNLQKYNNLNYKYGKILNETNSTTGDLDRNLNQYNSLIDSGRTTLADGRQSRELLSPEQSNTLQEELNQIIALPAGTREVRPGDYDSRVLTFEEMDTARKNKNFRDDMTRDDYIIDPSGFSQAKQGIEGASAYYDEREDRYLNAETPKDYANLLARKSYDTPKALAELSKQLGSYYYGDGSIFKGPSGSPHTKGPGGPTLEEKDREQIGVLMNNILGGGKLGVEYGLGYLARVFPFAPSDIKKYYNESEGWGDYFKKLMKDPERSRAWGLYDNTVAPLMGYDDPEKYPSLSDVSYIPGFSDLMGGKEGAGSDPYFGYESGFQPNKDLYNEKAYEVHPMMKELILEAEIAKAVENGDVQQAEKWQQMSDKGEFPANIDYSKFNRMNVRRNSLPHLIGALLPFATPGKAGQILQNAQKIRGLGMIAGTMEKAASGKALLAGAGAGVVEGASNRQPYDPNQQLDDDFLDVSIY
tara:strand:- start:693 stop:2309 length:1617 start_codon:yes stop_codon:yes gene_type:complete